MATNACNESGHHMLALKNRRKFSEHPLIPSNMTYAGYTLSSYVAYSLVKKKTMPSLCKKEPTK
jgi:hypothetical protein